MREGSVSCKAWSLQKFNSKVRKNQSTYWYIVTHQGRPTRISQTDLTSLNDGILL